MEQMDWTPYAGRWVALAQEQVAGVGQTPEEAQRLGWRNRPKERLTLRFVEAPGGEPLALPPLLDELRPLLAQQDVPVYLVGGAVRDALLGRPSQDLDFVTPRHALRLTFQVADALGLPAYVLDKERETGRVVLPERRVTLDFARFRGADLETDLRGRDFTVNALALPVEARTAASLIDPCGGLADLQERLLRLTSAEALTHDPVRSLRAIRQALSLGFALMPETETAVIAAAPLLTQVSIERIRDELLKLLETAVPHQAVARLHELSLLAQVLPAIAALDGVAQSAPHHEAVLPHTLSVLRWLMAVETAVFSPSPPDNQVSHFIWQVLTPYRAQLAAHLTRTVDGGVNGRVLLRLAALFHDAGKRQTQSIEAASGRIRFLGHDKVGAEIVARELRRLMLSNQAIVHVSDTVRAHMRPLLLLEAQGAQPTRRAIYRFFRDIGSAGLDVGLLALADHLATYNGPGAPDQWQALVALVAALYHAYFTRYEDIIAPSPLLNGRELMQSLQLSPGPEIGRLLRLIEEAQAAGQISSPAEALALARRERQTHSGTG